MRIDLTDISPVKKTLEVEVGPETVEQETQAVLRRYASQVRVPGFRPGKAPLSVIRTRFGKEVDEDVRERLLTRLLRDATSEKGLRPLGNPVLDEISHEAGEPFRFKTTFEVVPEFAVKDYRGVEVRRPEAIVTEEDVATSVEELRQSRTRLVAEEGRKAATGDFLVADLEGTPDEGEPFKHERVMLEVGAADNVPAFNENLEGAGAGAELEFTVEYPEDYESKQLAGRTVGYRIQVHEVKRREVPELDDEFAKDLGDFEDLEGLKGKVREDLMERRKAEAERELRQHVMDKVLLENPIPLPDVLVEEEIQRRLEDLLRAMMVQGMDPRGMDLDWKELRDRQEQPARKNVHARLVLDAVARAESLEVDQREIDGRLRAEAQHVGEKFEALRSKLKESGGLEALKNQMLREKSLDLLTSVANIQGEER